MATNDQILPTTGSEKARDDSSDEQASSQGPFQSSNGAPHVQLSQQNSPWWPAAGYGPLAHGPLSRVETSGERLPAFGGEFQPGLYKPPDRKLANPAPLGLAGFALTTFVLGLINVHTRGLTAPNIIVGPAYAYGGLCQLLAGMWEMAYGNTFGAWALSSYGCFWISLGIIFTPGGFDIAAAYGGETKAFYNALGLYLIGWFIYTFLVWLMTLKSTVAFSSLFLSVWLIFICLGCGYLDSTTVNGTTTPNGSLVKAGGVFGIIAAFIAWWNMLAGIIDESNGFFMIPVLHFPWSEKGRARRSSNNDKDVEKSD